jgi:hypothetical protein
MAFSAQANLGYGFDLGGVEGEWKVAGPVPDFIDVDSDEYDEDEGFDRLADLVRGSTASLERYGTYDMSGAVLVVGASQRGASWGCRPVELGFTAEDLARWDVELTEALALLGLTPTQEKPRWLMYALYS